jgi:cyclopropane fatty-acyl-phospholipid synthase-like methyltransferase
MPTSSKEGKSEIVNWCRSLTDINNILDIGAGKGTYVRLMKKNSIFIDSNWVGLEVWAPYIKKYSLDTLYNNIINIDARKIKELNLKNLDLVFLGDVLEHMTKEESINLVNELSSISKYCIISIPIVHYPQDEIEENPFEVHIKDDWSHQEVLDSFENIEKFVCGKEIGCYFLNFS